MCSESGSRSAPPTGTPARLQRPDDLVEQGARAGGPGSARRRSRRRAAVLGSLSKTASPRSTISLIGRARCGGRASCAPVSPAVERRPASTDSVGLSLGRSPAAARGRRRRGRRRAGGRWYGCVAAGRGLQARGRARIGEHRVDEGQHLRRRAAAGLQQRPRRTAGRRPRSGRGSLLRLDAQPLRVARPGTSRSTASRRRPRTRCAVARQFARRPAPAKNSPVRARRMSHCSGAVSCASSSRTWSMPPSSL